MSRFLFYLALVSMCVGAKYIAVLPNVSLFKVLFALAMLAGFFFARSGLPKHPPLSFVIAYGVMYGFIFFSGARLSAYLVGVDFGFYIGALMAAWGAILFIRSPKDIRGVGHVFVWVAVLNCFFAIGQYLYGGVFYPFVHTGREEKDVETIIEAGRLNGLFGNPNGLGGLLLIAILFVVVLSMSMRGLRKGLYLWLLTPLFTFVLLASYSRSALLAVVMAMLGFFSRAARWRTMLTGVVLLAVLLAVGYWFFTGEPTGLVAERWTGRAFWGGAGRIDQLRYARTRLGDAFAFGIGSHGFIREYGNNFHFSYFTLFLEQGVFAWVFFVFLTIAPAVHLFRLARKTKYAESGPLIWMIFWIYCALLVHTGLHGGGERNKLLWFFIGIAFQCKVILRRNPEVFLGADDSDWYAPYSEQGEPLPEEALGRTYV